MDTLQQSQALLEVLAGAVQEALGIELDDCYDYEASDGCHYAYVQVYENSDAIGIERHDYSHETRPSGFRMFFNSEHYLMFFDFDNYMQRVEAITVDDVLEVIDKAQSFDCYALR